MRRLLEQDVQFREDTPEQVRQEEWHYLQILSWVKEQDGQALMG